MSHSVTLCVCALTVIVVILIQRTRRLHQLPPSLPTIEKRVPKWKAYSRWTSSLGPIVTVRSFGQQAIIINSVEAVIDLFEKRSHFSCKPRWPMAELLGRQKNVGFTYLGERHKRTRKILHSQLNPTAVHCVWRNLLDDKCHDLLLHWLESPAAFYEEVHRTAEELIVQFAYGRKPDPEFSELAKSVMQETSIALQPGRWAVNSFPALMSVPEWVPGAGFQRWAKSARETFFALTRRPFYDVRDALASGDKILSFVAHAMEETNQTAEDEDLIMSAAGSLYGAGIETLSSVILQAVLLLVQHPEVQARAFAEIVSVVGKNRLPALHDRNALPYIECIIQEVHRFNPVVPLVPHSNTMEDWYLGYRIPEKSWIVANVWAMLHDEKEYPHPEVFSPERFLCGGNESVPRDPRTLAYGFGRRRCPGLHLANNFVFLVVSRTIALFELNPDTLNGKPVMPVLETILGIALTPKPFRCTLTPRGGAEELFKWE